MLHHNLDPVSSRRDSSWICNTTKSRHEYSRWFHRSESPALLEAEWFVPRPTPSHDTLIADCYPIYGQVLSSKEPCVSVGVSTDYHQGCSRFRLVIITIQCEMDLIFGPASLRTECTLSPFRNPPHEATTGEYYKSTPGGVSFPR